MISESTAAYLATLEETKGSSRIMVIDWGGGTLDVSIIENYDNRIKEAAVFGTHFGGDDIDRELAHFAHGKLNEQISDKSKRVSFENMPSNMQDIMMTSCESAKIELSTCEDDYTISFRDYGEDGLNKTIKLTSDMLDEIVVPIIEDKVIETIKKALDRAGISKESIDSVIVAGGSANLRAFEDIIIRIFGENKIIRPENYQTISAEGAAKSNYINGRVLLSDSLGIKLSDDTIFPILKSGIDGVNTEKKEYIFSLVEDSPFAYFIITNGNGKITHAIEKIDTKGYLNEKIKVEADIGLDQTATLRIYSEDMPQNYKEAEPIRINKLTFYYELPNLKIKE